ncbi:uncharacterized protein LOC110859630 isoform X2 [Folsomia candida]|uniref:uncharacterized protein LOC110859630 isoform X2 n=1 Tax=Folsomia candida TaxID=158441 RepID=UPI001604B46D|nr:uncharacterized protein LOC110859630 isoform X2 [Folsomia candida]
MDTFKFFRLMATCFLLGTILNSCKSTEIAEMEYLGHHKELFGEQENYRHYYVSASAASWTNANNECKNLFGKESGLVTLDTWEEKNALNRLLEDYGYGAIYWTSGLYDSKSEIWRWEATDTPVGGWAPWENRTPPSNPNALLRIGISFKNRFLADWIALWNTDLRRYICEVKYPSVSPTTTRLTTTAPSTTTKSPYISPPVDHHSRLIINVQSNTALDLYSANLTKGTPIQTYTISNDCSNLAEVWQLEPYTPYYIFRSVLGGSTSWKHSMTTNGTLPYLNEGTNQDSYWHVEPVSGTNYWNIYSNRYNSSGRSSLRNTGIESANSGIKLELAPLDPFDIAQQWELRKC